MNTVKYKSQEFCEFISTTLINLESCVFTLHNYRQLLTLNSRVKVKDFLSKQPLIHFLNVNTNQFSVSYLISLPT